MPVLKAIHFGARGRGRCDWALAVLLCVSLFGLQARGPRLRHPPAKGSAAPAFLPATFLPASTAWFLAAADPAQLPEGKGKEIVAKACADCHALSTVSEAKHSPEEWPGVVQSMIDRGASVSADDLDPLTEYLSKNFNSGASSQDKPQDKDKSEKQAEGSTPPKVNVNRATEKELETALQLTPKEAGDLVAYREKHGKYDKWEDLKNVPGLPTQRLQALKDRVDF